MSSLYSRERLTLATFRTVIITGTASMILERCPTLDDLSSWLDDQFGPTDQAEIGVHVDTCSDCQKNLEELTCRHAYRLRSLGGRLSVGTGRLAFGAMALAQERIATVAIEFGDYDGLGEVVPAAGRRGASLRAHGWDRGELTEIGDETSAECMPGADGLTQDYPSRDGEPANVKGRGQRWPAIPSYDVLGVIREGGMSVVYKARQRGLNRLVALKMIREKQWSRPDHLARIQIEAEAVARLRHPNIVQIHEIGEVDGLPFLSLEFLEGERSKTVWREIPNQGGPPPY